LKPPQRGANLLPKREVGQNPLIVLRTDFTKWPGGTPMGPLHDENNIKRTQKVKKTGKTQETYQKGKKLQEGILRKLKDIPQAQD